MAKRRPVVDSLGYCPNCGVSNLQYGAMVPEDTQMYYEVACLEEQCSWRGKEWYSMEFIEYTTDGEV